MQCCDLEGHPKSNEYQGNLGMISRNLFMGEQWGRYNLPMIWYYSICIAYYNMYIYICIILSYIYIYCILYIFFPYICIYILLCVYIYIYYFVYIYILLCVYIYILLCVCIYIYIHIYIYSISLFTLTYECSPISHRCCFSKKPKDVDMEIIGLMAIDVKWWPLTSISSILYII